MDRSGAVSSARSVGAGRLGCCFVEATLVVLFSVASESVAMKCAEFQFGLSDFSPT